MLGLGLAQPNLQQEKQADIVEAISDLRDICQLGYEDGDDEEGLEQAFEEIVEYLRNRLQCCFIPILVRLRATMHRTVH